MSCPISVPILSASRVYAGGPVRALARVRLRGERKTLEGISLWDGRTFWFSRPSLRWERVGCAREARSAFGGRMPSRVGPVRLGVGA